MKLSRKSILYRAIQSSGSLALVLVFTGSFSLQNFSLVMIAVVALLAALTLGLSFLWQYLVWKNYTFSIQQDSVKIKHGVLRKHDREIPLGRIQNVDVKRNIVQRVLNISQLNLETAGGSTSEASFRYLEIDDARDIQEEIRSRKKGENMEKAGETKKEKQDEPVYEITDKEIILLGIASTDKRVFGGVFAAMAIFPAFLGGLMESSDLGALTGLTVIFTGILFFTWISSTVSVILKFWGFKLHDRGESLEYERGLLNRSEGNIPKEKIQKLSFEENPVKRILGYSTLKIETAGYSPTQTMEKGAEAAIPLSKKSEIIEIANKVENFGEIQVNDIPKRARKRYASRYLIIASIIISGGFIASNIVQSNYTSLNYLSFILVPLALIASHLKWKNKGYGLNENHFVTMNGFWNRKTMITPYYRIQNLIKSETVIQRYWDLSTITLDTAGSGRVIENATAVDLDSVELEEVKSEVYRRFQNSLK